MADVLHMRRGKKNGLEKLTEETQMIIAANELPRLLYWLTHLCLDN